MGKSWLGEPCLRTHYDAEADILYLTIRRGSITDSEELDDDVRVEFDHKSSIVGIEIANARKKLARPFLSTVAKQLKAAR